ncbi:MAG: sigma-54 dependent transcriptional regulator [Calditrichia bacterium]
MKKQPYPHQPVLLIDDETQFLESAEFTLNSQGIDNTYTCSDSRKAIEMIARLRPSIVLLDLTMPYVKGWELLPQVVTDFPNTTVIILTAINEVDLAVRCMKDGAFDYMIKPVDDVRLVTTIRKAIELRSVQFENQMLKDYLLSDKLDDPDAFSEIITRNKTMRQIFQYAEAIARSPLPVLVTGETGVGKELIARAIHKVSKRHGEFVPVNVAGVDDNLFSDTLFGHKKGAFTGADSDRKGLIEQASRGTIFLDEIGDLAMESQVKLLRLLQEGRYYPIGSDTPKPTDARVIVATNADLEKAQTTGKFRKDLFYRLQTHRVEVPPLRHSKEDIPMLVDFFLEKSSTILGKATPTPPRELYPLLETYHFPGNIRELESLIFDAVSRHKSHVLSIESIRDKIGHTIEFAEENPDLVPVDHQIIFSEQLPTLKTAENMLINEAMRRADGNQVIAAQILGISRRALNNRLSRSKR